MKREAKGKKKAQDKCLCPYCEEEVVVTALPCCQPCGVVLRYCSRCQIVVEKEAKVCPKCGGKVA